MKPRRRCRAPRRRHKARLYAAASPEYWIVDLEAAVISVHTDPDPIAASHRVAREHRAGDELHLVAFPDVAVAVAEILG